MRSRYSWFLIFCSFLLVISCQSKFHEDKPEAEDGSVQTKNSKNRNQTKTLQDQINLQNVYAKEISSRISAIVKELEPTWENATMSPFIRLETIGQSCANELSTLSDSIFTSSCANELFNVSKLSGDLSIRNNKVEGTKEVVNLDYSFHDNIKNEANLIGHSQIKDGRFVMTFNANYFQGKLDVLPSWITQESQENKNVECSATVTVDSKVEAFDCVNLLITYSSTEKIIFNYLNVDQLTDHPTYSWGYLNKDGKGYYFSFRLENGKASDIYIREYSTTD